MRTPGNCCKSAYQGLEAVTRTIGRADNAELVHGLVTGTGGGIEGLRYGHAWVEINGIMVLDYSQARPMTVPRELYYRTGNIDPAKTVRYTLDVALQFLLDRKHYGPWEPWLHEQWIPGEVPEHIKESAGDR
ncbi:hypothetical protein [Thioalkalivibrio sp. ALE16]|uniref:hypothetical protein n=1 Tax=Thioalkalivibrio sp. ALE16 TaxID=1158172 RepID=UPI000367705A|nr:hypothetical protein [Thioalkalivibrio sp. ALE16]